jgi:hypothetical protein
MMDATIAIAFLAGALVSAASEGIDASGGPVRRLDALGALLIGGMTLPLVARRLLPRAVALVTVGCTVAGVVIGYPVGSDRSRGCSRSARWPTPPHAAIPSWSGSPPASHCSPGSLRRRARLARPTRPATSWRWR